MTDDPALYECLIVCTPETCWGSARLDGTRLTVESMVSRFNAGESIAFLAADYEVKPAAVEAMVRAVCLAAHGRRGMLRAVRRRLEEAADRNARKP